MRAIIPVFFVILGLGASDFAGSRLAGGLADADRHDITYLAREGLVACYEHAPPQAQRFLQELYSNKHAGRRRAAMHQHLDRSFQHLVIYRPEHPASRRATSRENLKLRGFGQRDQAFSMEQSIEIKFVVPAEVAGEEAAQGKSQRSRRRR